MNKEAGRNGERRSRSPPLLLFPCLDSTRPNGANPSNCFLRIDVAFGQQSRRYHTRATHAPAAVDEDAFARVETRAKVIADLWPFRLELRARRAHIGYGQVQPFHPSTLNFRAKPRDNEVGQLVRLKERDDRLCAPSDDRVQVLVEVSRPGSADCKSIVLARRKGYANSSAIRTGVDRGDLDWMAFTGSDHFFLAGLWIGSAPLIFVASCGKFRRSTTCALIAAEHRTDDGVIAGAFGTGHRSPPAGRGAKHRSSGPDGSLSQHAGRADPGARQPDAAQGGQDCERPEEGERG